MGHKFAELTFTPQVKAAQSESGSREMCAEMENGPDYRGALGPQEADFLSARDSFYLATVSETGWPYIQHRGGPPGFVRVLDEKTIGFADFAGNRQYITTGNLKTSSRVSLFFMDYRNRRRLKVLGHARLIDARSEVAAPFLDRLAVPGYRARIERAAIIDIAAFDWNCPQHITPRFTAEDIAAASQGMLQRIGELEAEVERLQNANSQSE